MTALVGVLNKHAVAIAADSAVTMGNTHKVVNSANKIFTLSKYHPVAVMTYSNASFMGVPWDIIIKEYRKQLKDTSFPELLGYVSDFIEFLHIRNFFCDDQTQHNFVKMILASFYNLCCDEIRREKGIANEEDITSEQIEEKLNTCLNSNKTVDKCKEFESLSFDDFEKYAGSDIESFAKEIRFENHALLSESFYYYLSAKFSIPFYTGLVFVGYGETEIYPSLYPINVVLGMANRLKYAVGNDVVKIGEHGPEAVIVPFAQIDVTQTIIRGINPSFQDIISNVIDKSVSTIVGTIANILDSHPSTSSVSSAIRNLDMTPVIKDMTLQINKQMRETYTDPLLNTVVSLDKEDMANMAESFISLTSLVRRMQPGEETVGGPVDVAVISKGDGFVWINRKHYFKPELNASFFSNYFK